MKLSNWLTDNGITQEDFAKKAGVHQTTISRIANGGRTSPETAIRVMKATQNAVTLEDILLDDAA